MGKIPKYLSLYLSTLVLWSPLLKT